MKLTPHQRVVKENAARSVLAGKNSILIRQVDAGGIHQINDWNAVAHGDFLRPQDLGDGLWPPRTGLHGSVVGHDDCRAPLDFADPGDNARRRRLTIVAVIGDQEPDLHKPRARIQQPYNPLTGREFSRAMLLVDALRSAAFAKFVFQQVQRLQQVTHAGGPRNCADGVRAFVRHLRLVYRA